MIWLIYHMYTTNTHSHTKMCFDRSVLYYKKFIFLVARFNIFCCISDLQIIETHTAFFVYFYTEALFCPQTFQKQKCVVMTYDQLISDRINQTELTTWLAFDLSKSFKIIENQMFPVIKVKILLIKSSLRLEFIQIYVCNYILNVKYWLFTHYIH